MSQSQVSDSQYEASHYADSFIDPELLQSDDLTDVLGSETPTSTHFSDLSLPPQYHHTLDWLECVSKPLQQHYILYNSDSRFNQSEDGGILKRICGMVVED